jgi:hypothetical protein
MVEAWRTAGELLNLFAGAAALVVHNASTFYMTLLNWGGPRVHDFVSINLCGPHRRTTGKHRSKDAYFRASKLSANVDGVSG